MNDIILSPQEFWKAYMWNCRHFIPFRSTSLYISLQDRNHSLYITRHDSWQIFAAGNGVTGPSQNPVNIISVSMSESQSSHVNLCPTEPVGSRNLLLSSHFKLKSSQAPFISHASQLAGNDFGPQNRSEVNADRTQWFKVFLSISYLWTLRNISSVQSN